MAGGPRSWRRRARCDRDVPTRAGFPRGYISTGRHLRRSGHRQRRPGDGQRRGRRPADPVCVGTPRAATHSRTRSLTHSHTRSRRARAARTLAVRRGDVRSPALPQFTHARHRRRLDCAQHIAVGDRAGRDDRRLGRHAAGGDRSRWRRASGCRHLGVLRPVRAYPGTVVLPRRRQDRLAADRGQRCVQRRRRRHVRTSCGDRSLGERPARRAGCDAHFLRRRQRRRQRRKQRCRNHGATSRGRLADGQCRRQLLVHARHRFYWRVRVQLSDRKRRGLVRRTSDHHRHQRVARRRPQRSASRHRLRTRCVHRRRRADLDRRSPAADGD